MADRAALRLPRADPAMAALRSRLADESAGYPHTTVPEITTLRGHGYRLETPPIDTTS